MTLPDCTRFVCLALLQGFTLEVTREESRSERSSGTSPGKFRLVLFLRMKKTRGLKQTLKSWTLQNQINANSSCSNYPCRQQFNSWDWQNHIGQESKPYQGGTETRGPAYLLWLQTSPSVCLMPLKFIPCLCDWYGREKCSSSPVQHGPWNLLYSDGLIHEIALHHFCSPITEIEFEVQVMQQHSIVSFY